MAVYLFQLITKYCRYVFCQVFYTFTFIKSKELKIMSNLIISYGITLIFKIFREHFIVNHLFFLVVGRRTALFLCEFIITLFVLLTRLWWSITFRHFLKSVGNSRIDYLITLSPLTFSHSRMHINVFYKVLTTVPKIEH